MAAPGVASVAAIPWWESPSFNPAVGPTAQTDPEYYSSLGGNLTVLFDAAGSFAPQTRFQPLFTSVDGCNTTFFGVPDSSAAAALGMPTGYAGEPDGFPNFFGTSAAAPNAAAVAALLRQANPSLSPAKINEALASTAIDITGERAGAGLDNVTGYGLIDADAAISKVWTGPNLAFAQPAGWSSQLVVSQQKGNFADQTLKAKAGTFVSFSVTNNGGLSISQTFTTTLVVDGRTRRQWKTRGLAAGASFTVTNLSIGKLSAGSHTFQVVTDAGAAVTELNEGDNQVTRSLAVAAKQ
jgi:subtilisin family serine protease